MEANDRTAVQETSHGTLGQVRRIGLWSTWFGVFPHPLQLAHGSYSNEERERFAAYIEQTPELQVWANVVVGEEACLLDNRHPPLDLSIRCDGCWVYPVSLSHYVRHGIQLPAPFVDHIRESHYQPPTASAHSETLADDFSSYWIHWSMRHSSWTHWSSLLCLVRMIVFLPFRWLLSPFRNRIRQRLNLR